jgi:hypothetical protein
MEILRIAENIASDGIEVTIEVPGSHEESDHVLSITDLSDLSISTQELSAAGGSNITFFLNKNYDTSYLVEILLDGVSIYSDTFDIVRPYVNPNTLGTTATEIAEYTKLERIARAIIDSVMDNTDFYNKKQIYEVSGNGLDIVPIWKDVNSVLSAMENNVSVYDASSSENIYTFGITKDKTAIYKINTDYTNLIDVAVPTLPISPTDYDGVANRYGVFRKGNDYTLVLDVGYKNIPSSIVDATTMLIEDLKCGKLDYFQRYVTSYNTDQFRIQFDKSILEGTGNILVDKILDKYRKSITRVGVL